MGASDESAWTIPEGAAWAEPLRQRGPGPVDLGIRTEHLGTAPAPLTARAVVRRVEALGHERLASVAVGPHALTLRFPARTSIGVGEPIVVGLDPEGIVWFDTATGLALR
jgi:ABC-type sugar transport system ATPase subunit